MNLVQKMRWILRRDERCGSCYPRGKRFMTFRRIEVNFHQPNRAARGAICNGGDESFGGVEEVREPVGVGRALL